MFFGSRMGALVACPQSFNRYTTYTGFENRYQLISQVEKFEKTRGMAQVLKMLPVVNLDLNKDQKQILNSTRNLFILGRSGTGKTTTTILRFFCQEIMYMAMRKQERLLNHYYNMGMQQKYTATKKAIPRLSSEDVKDTTNVKMVFVTASPVLTNEVKQYYASLREQLSAHLLVIEKAEAKKSEEDDGMTGHMTAEGCRTDHLKHMLFDALI